MLQGPWEDFKQPASTRGPWEDFQPPKVEEQVAPPKPGMPLPIPKALQPQADIPENLKALTLGVDPATLAQRMLGAASTITNAVLPAGDTPRPNALPKLGPEEEIGAKAATLGAVLSPAEALAKMGFGKAKAFLPSTERAGQKFQQIMAKAEDVPLKLDKSNQALYRAQQLEAHGSSPVPRVMKKFEKIQKPSTAKFGGQKITMEAQPMTYRTGRDFGSAASALSSEEKMGMAPAMKKQVADFAHALKTANREAAEKVGMAQQYDEAMKEYASAKNLEDLRDKLAEYIAHDVVKWGIRGAVGGTAAYEAYSRFRK